ncbi:hypothetical protein ABPG75_001249 [Micractinium tetrahymenae]
MAAALAPAGAQHVRWQPSEYAFDPYQLTVERLPQEDNTATSTSPSEAPAKGVAAAAAAAAPPVKRRPGRQKRTSVLCQVPGCNEELVDAKKYYRRYRICAAHCAMPCMMIEGRRQRFCQQCGRFHDIGEFEGAKRSCKRKLKRHNERRRTTTATAGKKAPTASWHSDSEADADDAFNVSSGSEAKKGGGAKRRAPAPARRAGAALAKGAKGAAASLALQPGQMDSHPSADYSAASQDTGSGGGTSAARLTQSPCGTPPPHAGLHQHSPSGSLNSSAQRLGAPEAHAAAVSPARAQLGQHAQHAQQQRFFPAQPEAMEVQVSPAPSAAPASPHPAHALASAPTVQQPDADLDTVLQQLLQDEDLQGLQLDPLEMFMANGGQVAAKLQAVQAVPPRPAPAPVRAPAPAPVAARAPVRVPAPRTSAAPGAVAVSVAPAPPRLPWGSSQQQAFPSIDLADIPMELLDDIAPLPVHGQLAASSAAASGRSGATVALTSSASRGSGDLGGLGPAMGSTSSTPWLPAQQAQQAQQQAWRMAQRQQQAPVAAPPPALPSNSSVAPGVLASAHGMLSAPGMVAAGQAAPLVGYGMQASQEARKLTSLSLKVFNCTPDQLLPSVRAELEDLMQVGGTLLEGYVRPGCTQLTVNALMSQQRVQELKGAGLGAMVADLLARCRDEDVLQQDMLVQFEDELAVVKRRKVAALIALQHSPALVPTLAPLLPLAVHATPAAPAAAPLLLRGRLLADDRDLILARQQGCNLTVEVHAVGAVQAGEYAKVRLLGLLPGWVDVEVQHGSFLSRPRALLALPCAAAVAEVRQLERGAAGIACVDDFLRDMGLVAQYLQRHEMEAEGYPCPAYTPALLAAIAGKARDLVAAAVARGWAATAELLLPAVTADGMAAADAVAALNACCPPGMTLLHVAVGTGSVAVVQELAAWAQQAGCRWEVNARCGNSRVTPLHVAALLPSAAEMRAALTSMDPATSKLWGLVQASDGTTPEGLADAIAAAAAAAAAVEQALETAASCSSEVTSEPALKAGASTSKAAALPEKELAGMGGLPEAAPLLAAGAGHKGKAFATEEEQAAYNAQRRHGRQALKQQLDDMHMTSMLSEVESGLDTAAQAPRPLADALRGAVATGAALLRALRPNQ